MLATNELAAVQGYENAQEVREIVAKQMNPYQIVEVQRMARE